MDARFEVPLHLLIYVVLLYFCQLNTVNGGWKVVFKAVTGGSKDVYTLYSSSETMNADNPLAAQLDLTVDDHYKSEDINNWTKLNISLVRLSTYKDGEERAHYVFNGTNTDSEGWMSHNRLISTSYIDLMELTTQINFFSIEGTHQGNLNRRFYINRSWGGCPNDIGWLLVYDLSSTVGCHWETKMETKPAILYSPYNSSVTYDAHTREDILADFLAIQIYTEEPNEDMTSTLTTDMNLATYQESTLMKINSSTFTNTSSSGLCLCKCQFISNPDIEMQLFKEILNSLKVIKSKTSAYVRSKTSASDRRVSAQATGYIGILIIVIVLGSIVLPDCITLAKKLSLKRREMMTRYKKQHI